MKSFRIFFATLLMFVITNQSQAQISLPSVQTLTKFKNSTTYIVLEGGMFSEFDNKIKKSASQYWNITPYKIIDMNEYERLCKNPANSFLMLVDGQYTIMGKILNVNLLTLVMGDKSGNINKMPEILSIPLAVADEDGFSENYGYKLGGILRSMQYLLNNLPSEKVTLQTMKDFLQKEKSEIKNSRLLLTDNDFALEIYKKTQIPSFYKHAFDLVSEDVVEQAIEKKENACFCHVVGENGKYCFKLIISCKDGTIFYGNYHQTNGKNPVGLLQSDFEEIN